MLPSMMAAQNVADTVSIVNSINNSGSIKLNQPEALSALLLKKQSPAIEAEKETTPKEQATTRSGYRVQVFDDNNPHTARRNAENTHQRLVAEFPYLRSYITFNSPYWRVKAGDFRTRAEAEAAMAQIQEAFPSLSAYIRVVRDKINIID